MRSMLIMAAVLVVAGILAIVSTYITHTVMGLALPDHFL